MESPLWLLAVGLLFVLVFGGMSLMRREGLSLRFAIEAVAVTLLFTAIAALTSIPVHYILFLVVLYLITMRVRILVDFGNLFARRGSLAAADRTYRLALRIGPDDASRLLVRINQGVLAVQQNRLDDAISLLTDVLKQADKGYLGLKHHSACLYNLAVAYQKKGLDAQAVRHFNAVLETWPGSDYGRLAAVALARRKNRRTATPPGQADEAPEQDA